MNKLPIAPVERIIRNNSGLRVSDEAAKHLTKVLEEKGHGNRMRSRGIS